MASKEVADLNHAADWTGVEFHVVWGVVRDGAGNVTNHGHSRRVTSAEFEAHILADVVFPASGISQAAADARYFRTRAISCQVLTSSPAANEILGLYPAVEAFTLAANFAGSKAAVLANPAASFTITVSQQVAGAGAFAAIGTITISTAGAVAWATTGGVAIAIAAGDVIKFAGSAGGDTTFLGAFTLIGTK